MPEYRELLPEESRLLSFHRSVCVDCGVEVWDKKAHNAWHNQVERNSND